MDCSISLKFGIEFDAVIASTLQVFKVKDQRSTSQRNVRHQNAKVRNGQVDRLQTWHGSVMKNEWRGIERPQVQCIAIATFSSYYPNHHDIARTNNDCTVTCV